MKHQIVEAKLMTRGISGVRFFKLTFCHRGEYATCYVNTDTDFVEVPQLDADSQMDEIVMERMSEEFMNDAAHYFFE